MLSLAIGLTGCGEPTCVDSTGELGSCCQADEISCAEGLECFGEFPAGLCSRACDDQACPTEAYCVTIQSQSQGDLGKLCLPLCGDEFQITCREGYACRQTSLPQIQVCFPD